ncbi:MAG: hypothetical protein ACE5F9_15175 [Phycisphaerae bacterium]
MRVLSGRSRGGLAAVGLIAVVLAVMGVRELLRTNLPPLEPVPPKVEQRFSAWFDPLQREWAGFTMTPFSDVERVREQLTVLANDAIGPGGFEATPEKRAALVDSLTTFFNAWSSPSPAEYLRKIAPQSRPMEHPADGSGGVMGAYKLLTGRVMPLDTTAEEALAVFWKGRPECRQRPVAGSFGAGEAIIEFTLHKVYGGPRNRTQWGRFQNYEIMRKWIGPLSQSVPSVTESIMSDDKVRAAYGPVEELSFTALVVETPDRYRCVMHVQHYWSPDRQQWYLHTIGFVTPDFVTWAY